MSETTATRFIHAVVCAIGLSVVPAAQQERPGFSILNGRGAVAMAAVLRDQPFRSGDMASVGADLQPAQPVPGKNGQWLSSVGFYGWSEAGKIRIAIIGELHPSGTGGTSGAKPRDIVLATYDMAVGETRMLDELKPLGLDLVSVRIDSKFP